MRQLTEDEKAAVGVGLNQPKHAASRILALLVQEVFRDQLGRWEVCTCGQAVDALLEGARVQVESEDHSGVWLPLCLHDVHHVTKLTFRRWVQP